MSPNSVEILFSQKNETAVINLNDSVSDALNNNDEKCDKCPKEQIEVVNQAWLFDDALKLIGKFFYVVVEIGR